MTAEIVAHLVDEMEEYYGAFDYYPLYLLGWELNDGRRTTEQRHELASRAYDEFTARHPTRIVWVSWPLVLEAARPADPGAPLDFDINTSGEIEGPFLALVPDS